LETFKASLDHTEQVIAEWQVQSVRKNGAVGNPHALILSDKTLYNLKLDNTRQHLVGDKKYYLLDISTIHNGYISKVDPTDLLDPQAENPSNYALRIYIGNEYYKTFKCDSGDYEPDELQKGTHFSCVVGSVTCVSSFQTLQYV